MSLLALVSINLTFIVATFFNVVTGFGFAIIAVPILSLLLGPKASILYIAVSSLLLKIIMIWRTRHDFEWPVLEWTIAGVILGVVPGSYVLMIISSSDLNLFLGGVLLVAVYLMGKKIKLPVRNLRWGRFWAGILSGFFTGCTSVGGPPLAVWFANEEMPKVSMRANLTWIFASGSILMMLGSVFTGTIHEIGDWHNILYMLPGLIIGDRLGQYWFKRIDQERFQKLLVLIVLLGAVASLFTGISEKLSSAKPAPAVATAAQMNVAPSAAAVPVVPPVPALSEVKAKYQNRIPKLWSEDVPGVLKRIKTEKKIVFLTFDACGGRGGNQYDRPLLDFLRSNQVKATLFLNSRWIEANPEIFRQLAADQLFSIQNHGTKHCPLSVNGKSIYKISGTDSVAAVYQEIMGNDAKIKALTGIRPRLFRSGTAYYDEVSAQIAQALGYTLCGFDILGDAGATYSRDRIIKAAQAVKPGSIIIYHMNQPQSSTCAGVKAVVAQLRSQGYEFGKLVDYLN